MPEVQAFELQIPGASSSGRESTGITEHQVCLPASTKANIREAGPDVKVVYFQVRVTWKMGDSCLEAHLPGRWGAHLKAHLHLSVEAEVFIRRERGTEQRDRGRGLERSVCADEHSPF